MNKHRAVIPEAAKQNSGIQTGRNKFAGFPSLLRNFGMTVALVLSTQALTLHADYQAGLDAYQQGDYDTALGEWLTVARSPPGEVHPAIQSEACYAIAMLFWTGQGVPQDTAVAAGWLEQAARLHHAGAQTKLGFLYSSGQGVQQSDFEALKWFLMAANQGDADAQFNLGVLYREGIGVPANGTEALKWFREAASNGDVESARIVTEYEAGIPIGSSLTELEQNAGSPFVDDKPQDVSLPQDQDPAVQAESSSLPAEENVNATEAAFGEDWIRARNPEHYTIQVIALLQPEKLFEFMGQNPDWSPYAIYQQKYQGKPLYVLVQGDYPDVDLARAAGQNFPAGIQQRDKLWIRRFVMVQGLLP